MPTVRGRMRGKRTAPSLTFIIKPLFFIFISKTLHPQYIYAIYYNKRSNKLCVFVIHILERNYLRNQNKRKYFIINQLMVQTQFSSEHFTHYRNFIIRRLINITRYNVGITSNTSSFIKTAVVANVTEEMEKFCWSNSV